MATQKQKRAVKKTLENPGKSISAVMREVGYSPNTANTPKELTESNGYKELCIELGLTPELIANSVKDDIEAKEGNRIQELKLGADMLGMTKHDSKDKDKSKEGDTTINIDTINIIQDAKLKEFREAVSRIKRPKKKGN